MAVNAFQVIRDVNNENTLIRVAPSYIEAQVLAAGVAESVTVPTGARIVLFSANSDFYCNPNGTAAVPSGDTTDGSASELNPAAYELRGLASFSLIAAAATIVTMAFYS